MGFIKSQAPAFMVQRGLLLVEAPESPYCLRLKAHEQEMSEKRTGPTWAQSAQLESFQASITTTFTTCVSTSKCMGNFQAHSKSS